MTKGTTNPLSINLSYPVVMGTLENPATISADVLFGNPKDCHAREIFVRFTCVAQSKFVVKKAIHENLSGEYAYADERWDWDIERQEKGLVPAGHYTKSVSKTMHPYWPSSCSHKHGSVSYMVTVTIKNVNQYGYLVVEHEAQAEVWVLNSTLPPKSLGMYDAPRWTQSDWQDRSLRCTLSLKSGTVFLGQSATLKVYMYKFLQGCLYDGRDVDVRGAQFTLVETRVLRAKNREETYRDVHEVARIKVVDGWPEGKGNWNMNISMRIPASPALSTSMRTTYMDISHHIAMILEVKSPKARSSLFSKVPILSDMIILRAQVDIVVAVARPDDVSSQAFTSLTVEHKGAFEEEHEQKDMEILEEKR